MVINEENQRRVFEINSHNNVTNEVNDSIALMSSKDNQPKFRRFNNLYCEYCRNKGHTRETCYKLVGYLPGFKGKRQQQYRQANMDVSDDSFGKSAAVNEDNVGMNQGMLNFFTDEQYNQIMNMINKDKSEEHAANMAGNANLQSLETIADFWIIDTGATDHMESNNEMLKTITGLPDSKGGNVNLPNGKTMPVICKVSYNLTYHDEIHDVLCVPDFKYNLLSMSKLTKELQCSVNFFPNILCLSGPIHWESEGDW